MFIFVPYGQKHNKVEIRYFSRTIVRCKKIIVAQLW